MVTGKKHRLKKRKFQKLDTCCDGDGCEECEDFEDDECYEDCCDFGCELCDPDDTDWDDEEEDEWEDKPREKKGRKRRYGDVRKKYITGKEPYPEFDWDSLPADCAPALRELIKAAENQLIPDKGLHFTYAQVNLSKMSELDNKYLLKICEETNKSRNRFNGNGSHEKYHGYLWQITDWYLNNQ